MAAVTPARGPRKRPDRASAARISSIRSTSAAPSSHPLSGVSRTTSNPSTGMRAGQAVAESVLSAFMTLTAMRRSSPA